MRWGVHHAILLTLAPTGSVDDCPKGSRQPSNRVVIFYLPRQQSSEAPATYERIDQDNHLSRFPDIWPLEVRYEGYEEGSILAISAIASSVLRVWYLSS
jgi:hypothetical protein